MKTNDRGLNSVLPKKRSSQNANINSLLRNMKREFVMNRFSARRTLRCSKVISEKTRIVTKTQLSNLNMTISSFIKHCRQTRSTQEKARKDCSANYTYLPNSWRLLTIVATKTGQSFRPKFRMRWGRTLKRNKRSPVCWFKSQLWKSRFKVFSNKLRSQKH